MPAMHARTGSRRRTISEINMVPFIDVMLVLLIIFMVSAPLITTGVVELPSVGKSKAAPQRVIALVVAADETVRLRIEGKEGERIPLTSIAEQVRQAQQGFADAPVVIEADKNVRYEQVVKVMDRLQTAGVARVGLLVKKTGS